MNDRERRTELRQQYADLLQAHGEEAVEHEKFRLAMLELNRKHRQAVLKMYEDKIKSIQEKKERQGGPL